MLTENKVALSLPEGVSTLLIGTAPQPIHHVAFNTGGGPLAISAACQKNHGVYINETSVVEVKVDLNSNIYFTALLSTSPQLTQCVTIKACAGTTDEFRKLRIDFGDTDEVTMYSAKALQRYMAGTLARYVMPFSLDVFERLCYSLARFTANVDTSLREINDPAEKEAAFYSKITGTALGNDLTFSIVVPALRRAYSNERMVQPEGELPEQTLLVMKLRVVAELLEGRKVMVYLQALDAYTDLRNLKEAHVNLILHNMSERVGAPFLIEYA